MDWKIPFSPTSTSVSSHFTSESSVNRTARALFKDEAASYRKVESRPIPLGTITNMQNRRYGGDDSPSNTMKQPKPSSDVVVSTSPVASVSQLKKWLVDVEKKNRTRSISKPPRPAATNHASNTETFGEDGDESISSKSFQSKVKSPVRNFSSGASVSEKVVDMHRKIKARSATPSTPDRHVNIPMNKVTEMKKILMDFERNNNTKQTASYSSKKRAIIKERLNKVADIRQWLNDMEASPSTKKTISKERKGLDLPMNRVREMKNWLIEFEKQNKEHSKRFQGREGHPSYHSVGDAPIATNHDTSIEQEKSKVIQNTDFLKESDATEDEINVSMIPVRSADDREEDEESLENEEGEADEIMNKIIDVSFDHVEDWEDEVNEETAILDEDHSSDSEDNFDENECDEKEILQSSREETEETDDPSAQIDGESVVDESDILSVIDYLREEATPSKCQDSHGSDDDTHSNGDGSADEELLGEDLLSVSQIVTQISSRSLCTKDESSTPNECEGLIEEEVVEVVNVGMKKKKSKRKIRKIIGAMFHFFRQKEQRKHVVHTTSSRKEVTEDVRKKGITPTLTGIQESEDSQSMELSPDSQSMNNYVNTLGDDMDQNKSIQRHETSGMQQNPRGNIQEKQLVLKSPTMSVASAYERALSPESSCAQAVSPSECQALVVAGSGHCRPSKNVAQHVSFLQDVYGKPKSAKTMKDNYYKKSMHHHY